MDDTCAHLPTDRPAVGRLRPLHAASRVGVGLGNPHAPCRTTPGQAMPCSAGSLCGARCHHLAAGEAAWTMPSRALCAIPSEARHARAGVMPRGLASLVMGYVILACSVLWLGHS
jgi:hypothetical protein